MSRFEAPIHFAANTGNLGTNFTDVIVKAIKSFAHPVVQVIEPLVGPLVSHSFHGDTDSRRQKITFGAQKWKIFVTCSGALHQARDEGPREVA